MIKSTMVKKVFTKKPCKGTKERKGVGGRCVKKCKSYERRRDGVCKRFTKPGYTYNELSGRFVSNSGPTAKWIRGKGPAPSGYVGTYRQELSHYL